MTATDLLSYFEAEGTHCANLTMAYFQRIARDDFQGANIRAIIQAGRCQSFMLTPRMGWTKKNVGESPLEGIVIILKVGLVLGL